jgi:hypothetical protein
MNGIKPQYVTFEIAKLLKDKGLKLNFCREIFYRNPNNESEFVCTEMIHDWELIENREWYSAPTIAEVVYWIYSKYDIWLEVLHCATFNQFTFKMSKLDNKNIKKEPHHMHDFGKGYTSPTEAYLAAIEFCLKKLI